MTKIQRVKKVCKWLIFIDFADNDTDLAKKIGYTKSSFSQIMNEKVPLSDKFVNALANTNENINIVWINEEKGEMLRNEELQLGLNEKIEKIQKELDFKTEQVNFYQEKSIDLQKKLEDCESEKKPIKTIS